MTHIATVFLLFAVIGCSVGVNFIDICKDGFSTVDECCKKNPDDKTDLGMEKHQYQVIYEKRSHTDQSIECRIQALNDPDNNYQLVTFETRKEYDCVMKYLGNLEPNFGAFYIGLKADSSDSSKNIFQWESPMPTLEDGETLTFTNWAATSPAGKGDCVTIGIGATLATNGLWVDSSCDVLLPTVCERYPKSTSSKLL